MGSVYDEITRLETAKTDIETAIEECGVNVPDTKLISDYASYIRQIPSAVFSGLNVDPIGGDDKYIKIIEQNNGLISATTGGLVSSTSSGLTPKIGTSASATISTQADEWVLTSTNGGSPTWRKLPSNAFKNDNTNTTYSLSGALSGNTYITTLTNSDSGKTTATIPEMSGATSTAAGTAGLVPAPAANKHTAFLRGDGTWVIPTNTNYYRPISVNGTLILGNNNTALNLVAGTNISITAENSSGYTGKVTITNTGVRSTTINGNYLRVNTNGTNTDLTIPYATTANMLARSAGTNVNSCYEDLKLKYYTLSGCDSSVSTDGKRYAGTDNSYGFPVSNNANGMLWLGSHVGNYGHQLGFSSDGRIYDRYISNGSFSTIKNGGSWKKIAWTSDIPSVGNGTVTIKQKGIEKGSFTMNQSGNTTIELTDNNTDTKVTQTISTGNAAYRVLLSGNANDTTETTTARKSAKLQFNPSSGKMGISGSLEITTSITDHSNPSAQCLVINSTAIPSDTPLSLKNSPGIGFHISNNSWASLVWGPGGFNFINSDATAYQQINTSMIKCISNGKYISITPANSSYVHYTTDAAIGHYFNTTVHVNGAVAPYGNNSFTSGTVSYRWSNVYAVKGNFSGQITSSVATGISPFSITSTTKNTNLNADMLDGYHIWTGTRAQYNATAKDNNTIYLIHS